MDYNTEQLYAPMYGSGRGALASAYFRMLMDHTPLARRNAAYCAFSPTYLFHSIRIIAWAALSPTCELMHVPRKRIANSSLNSHAQAYVML